LQSPESFYSDSTITEESEVGISMSDHAVGVRHQDPNDDLNDSDNMDYNDKMFNAGDDAERLGLKVKIFKVELCCEILG
jgi:hypothetical protein